MIIWTIAEHVETSCIAIGNKLEIVSLKVTPIRSIMSSDDILVDDLTVGSSLRVCMEYVRWVNVWMCPRNKRPLEELGVKKDLTHVKYPMTFWI